VACRWRTCRTRSRCGIVIAIALLALFAGHTGASVKRIFAADAPTKPSTDEDVLADRPLAVWRFEEPAGAKRATAERFAAEPLPADMSGTVVFGEAGPRPPRHPTLAKDNTAALFGSGRSFLKISGSAAGFAELQFTNGDSITLESWVNPFELTEGQQVYIIGKGRTSNPKVAADNQNWALRLSSTGGEARPSFLFRNSDNRKGHTEDFHRWIADEGFAPGTGWHHVAVSYTFGEPDSIRGYVDGRPVTGTWDFGGPTTKAPVVDDDEVWIGSSINGNMANTFPGLLDDVAIHRSILSPERIAARWVVDETVPPLPIVTLAPVPEAAVLCEIIERVPDGSWYFGSRAPTESFTRPFFAFTDLPQRYDDSGLRADRPSPFVIRIRSHVVLPEGPQQITVRSRGAARVFLDGKRIAEIKPPKQRSDGHEKMFVPDRSGPAGMRIVQPGDQQVIVDTVGDGRRHLLHVEVGVGGQNRRPETGEFSASIGPPGKVPTIVAATDERIPLTDAGWTGLAARLEAERVAANTAARRAAAAKQANYWQKRHEEARRFVESSPGPAVPELSADHPEHTRAVHNAIDRFINARLIVADITPAPLADDAAFIRRLSLDVRGIVPMPEEIEAFLADTRPDRRDRLVDAFLADPRWADHWVGYWQDVLAENPNLVNPTLNNTGPFRFWIHESFLDRKPIDRMVTELVMMGGSTHFGGPGGFALATENDVPMAAKAHVLSRAFLAMEMNCARCHDAPNHRFVQQDLFSLAAMLARGPQKVPATSSVPGGAERLARLAISVTLEPGTEVKPAWPFDDVVSQEAAAPLVHTAGDTREQLAALITAPHNARFARVLVNRLWERYLGRGLVADPDDWESETASHPELLDWLARELVSHDYSLEHVARLILTSHTYGRGPLPADHASVPASLFAGRQPRRMSAEQLLDSLSVASGKPFDVEPMNIDVDASRPATLSLNLGRPTRAWQFAGMANERDRPSLSLPFAQHSVTLMEAFGWRAERQAPLTHRETDPNALQPAIIANGVAVKRASQFSDSSDFTQLAVNEIPLDTFIDGLFLRILGRRPNASERSLATDLLADGYASRRIVDPPTPPAPEERPLGVSWSNHVTAEADRAKETLAAIAAKGDTPTTRLDADWRERAEDLAWTLFNTPEFVFVP
jgi:hypothetical protein